MGDAHDVGGSGDVGGDNAFMQYIRMHPHMLMY